MLHMITMSITLLGVGFVVATAIHDSIRRRRPPHPVFWALPVLWVAGSAYFIANPTPARTWFLTVIDLILAFGALLAAFVCLTQYWLPLQAAQDSRSSPGDADRAE